jgi:hypothetical protein
MSFRGVTNEWRLLVVRHAENQDRFKKLGLVPSFLISFSFRTVLQQ